MTTPTLEDHLRNVTRNFTSRLSEDDVLAIGCDLARELARAHAESPARHPEIDLRAIAMVDGRPRLEGGGPGDASEDLLRLGALLTSLAVQEPPHVSWRLDGPPPVPASTLARRAVFAALGSPRDDRRFATAEAALRALEEVRVAKEGCSSPWPMFRGDAARTGARSESPSLKGLARLWDAPLGAVVSSPVVVEPFVIACTASGRLVFVDRASGRIVHEMPLASAIESSPAVAGRRLYVGTDDGELVAVDVVDGSVLFRVRIGQLVRSSPLVLEDVVVIGVMEGKTAGSLVALDSASGKVRWKRKLAAIFSSPAASPMGVIVGADDGRLHAVEAKKGGVLWSHPLASRVRATPAVAGDLVVCADFTGRIAALRVSDGSPAWQHEVGQAVYSSPCVAAGLVVFGGHDGKVRALDVSSGAPRWEVATHGPVVASASAAGGAFLIGSTDGEVYLIDATGAVLARLRLSAGAIQSSACFAFPMAYLGTHDGLTALRLDS